MDCQLFFLITKTANTTTHHPESPEPEPSVSLKRGEGPAPLQRRVSRESPVFGSVLEGMLVKVKQQLANRN